MVSSSESVLYAIRPPSMGSSANVLDSGVPKYACAERTIPQRLSRLAKHERVASLRVCCIRVIEGIFCVTHASTKRKWFLSTLFLTTSGPFARFEP